MKPDPRMFLKSQQALGAIDSGAAHVVMSGGMAASPGAQNEKGLSESRQTGDANLDMGPPAWMDETLRYWWWRGLR